MLGELGSYLKQRDLCISLRFNLCIPLIRHASCASSWGFLVYSFLINISVYSLPSAHLKTFTKHTHGRKQRGGEREATGSRHVLNMKGAGMEVGVVVCILLTVIVKFLIKQPSGRNPWRMQRNIIHLENQSRGGAGCTEARPGATAEVLFYLTTQEIMRILH